MRFLLWAFFFHSFSAHAASLSESFDTISQKASSSLIWNIGLGRLQPTMTVSAWKPFPFGARSSSLDFGDGRHGAFNSTTLQNFDSDPSTPTVIDLDTTVYPALQVTSFELPNGYFLKPVGSNPLVIRSLSDVRLLGTAEILCSGTNGADTQFPESLTSAGGQGRCGGGNGGNGGSHSGVAFVAAEQGYLRTGATNPIGGFGGANGTNGGGGGGALYNAAAAGDGYDPTVAVPGLGTTVPGTAGTNFNDEQFTSLIGSAGGGGGGAYKVGVNDSSGAGGGGGGGVVLIYALQDFYNEGFVRANGGNGGGVTGTQLGGLGGGGGGGTVVIIAGRDYTNNGQVLVAGGTGGARAGNDAGRGGDGGPGRAWYTDNDNALAGTGSEDTSCILQVCGTVVNDIGTLQAITTSIDLQNTRPSISSIQLTSIVNGGSSVTVTVAGSKDNFSGDDTGWQSIGALDTVSKKRYLRFRVQIDNQVALTTSATYLDAIRVDYAETEQDNFIFGAGCGQVQSISSSSVLTIMLHLLFQLGVILFPFFWIKLAHQLRPKNIFGNN